MFIQSRHYVRREEDEHQKIFSFVKMQFFGNFTSQDSLEGLCLTRKKRTKTLKEKTTSIFDHTLAPQGNEILRYVFERNWL